jgi:hypothetical protein
LDSFGQDFSGDLRVFGNLEIAVELLTGLFEQRVMRLRGLSFFR